MQFRKYEHTGLRQLVKKEDLEKVGRKKMFVRNRYIEYPLYDTDNNSFIKRYRLWMRYRDVCKKRGRSYVDCKTFGKIINQTNELVAKYIVNDPRGVTFSKFKLMLTFSRMRVKYDNFKFRKYMQDHLLYPSIQLTSKLKKRKYLAITDYVFEPSTKIKRMVKEANINSDDYEVAKVGRKKDDKFDYDDMFNDLK